VAKEIRHLTFDEFADELMLESQPRTLVILSASQIDVQLKNIVEKFFWPKSAKAKDSDELLEGDSPLSTFSSKIKIAKRLGLIDVPLYELLEKFRDIRNKAAHWRVFRVSESPLRENLKDLAKRVTGRKSYRLTKEKYFGKDRISDEDLLKSVLLTICVLVASIENHVDKISLRSSGQIKLD
jgi:hypothetical protein